VLLLRDMVAAFGIGLEGHDGHPGSELGQAFHPVLPPAPDIGSVQRLSMKRSKPVATAIGNVPVKKLV
jgi:hypothetical protein